jgi:hypothetical protein
MLRRRVLSVEQQNEFSQRLKDICNARPLAPASTELPSAVVRGELRSLLIHSVVFAVVIPALISYSGGELVLAGWAMSLFVVVYLFCCSLAYTTPPPPLGKIFVTLSYVGLLAFCVGSVVSSVLGMLFIYVDSILAAGLFGSVLAQYGEAKGREKAAFVAVAKAPHGLYQRNIGIYFFLGLLVMFYVVLESLVRRHVAPFAFKLLIKIL